ncbi:unnamed protein product [Rotaria sp. Silwood1]|nr:unnamed protein product [Rotaria sp. Silwood1]CAF4868435.1 unnamed protein product [Rotaria sp. Silwood1]
MKVETMAWITDDEAEFWTSTSPTEKNHTSYNVSTSKNLSSDIFSSDGLYFKINNQLDTEMQEHLSLLYKQATEKSDKEEKSKVENKQIFDIFQLNHSTRLNGNNPQKPMGFLGRLYHQLTRSSTSEIDYLDDEPFTIIDESEIIVAINDNTNIDSSSNVENKVTDTISFLNKIRSFIDELVEEKDVIMGTIDEETLFNRRSRKAKSSLLSIKNNHISDIQTSF